MAGGSLVCMELADVEVLRTVMQAHSLTTRSLGKRAGVSHSLIGHLRSGARTSCSPDSARKIAAALGVAVDDLFVTRINRRVA